MDSEVASKIIKQAFEAKGVEAHRQEEDFVIVDLESQDTTQFVPNRLQAILTLQWLSQHYESVEGVSLPRCLIYKHYYDYCHNNQFRPVNAASFGKVIRQVFPELRTRRLGTRGQSKYHYYGIRVKESSPYFGVFLDSQRIAGPAQYRSSGFPILSSKSQWEASVIAEQSALSTPMTSILTLLPEFPTAAQTQPWEDIEFEQVDAVISQYRCHCQQIVESIVRGRLEEVPMAVQQFWQSIPDTMRLVLQGSSSSSSSSSDKLADLIALCDNILYHTLMNILIPGTVQQLPPSLLHTIRHFSCGFQNVVEESLLTPSEYLHLKQVETAKRFCQLLKRKTSLSHLAQATRAVLKTKMTVTQMSHDWWKRTEQNTVCSQLMWTVPGNSANIKTVVKKCFSEFSRLLEKHASVEEHIKWLHTVRSKCLQNATDGDNKEEVERDFLLQWSYVCNLLIRDQTLRSATSFGSFHLLHLLYEEYLLYMVDVQQNQKQERAQWKRLFDTDTEVPSYFLTSADASELNEAKFLPSAPFITPEQLYQLGPNSSMMSTDLSSRVSVDFTTGLDNGAGQYVFHPYATSSGRIHAKPAAAGSPYQSATTGGSAGEASRNGVAYTMPSLSTSSVSNMPSKSSQGYLGGGTVCSPIFPSPKQSSSPKAPQLKVEKDASCGSRSYFSGGPGVVTIPLGGSVAYLQTSPSSGGSFTILPSGYKMASSSVARQAVTQQQQQPAAAPASMVQGQTGSSSSEPPPLQPISSQSHLRSPASQKPPTLPQQKLLATKIIKAIPVSSGSKQKPVSFQFSITTSQKLNLVKGQILTTTNGERYLINEVQTSMQQADSTQEISNEHGK